MSSLSAHLRQPEDHSRLPFHPSCPVCRRDRLAGSLDGEELLSRRAQAAIAAGLLAFSTFGVPVASAQEADQISEGTAEVVDGGGDASSDVNLELDGDVIQVTEEAPTAAPPPVEDDDGPLEEELATQIQGSAVDTTEDAADVAPDAAVPEVSPPAPEPAVPVPAEPAPAPATPAEDAVESDPGPVAAAPERRGKPRVEQRSKHRPEPAAAPAPAPVPAPAAEPTVTVESAPTATPAPAPAETVPVAVVQSRGSTIETSDRFHVVRPGESLWSIAADRLGDEATVAQIAREVNRLWELNDERIGTGRPDLLYAGTRLRLR
jgi:nucleoid-associated protein YgaU